MQKIKVGHYPPQKGGAPGAINWSGYVEPVDKAWILFIADTGETQFYNRRDADGGVKDEALCLPAASVAGTMKGACEEAIGVAEWAWCNEFGGLDKGDGHELARRIRAAVSAIDIDATVGRAFEAIRKDGEL